MAFKMRGFPYQSPMKQTQKYWMSGKPDKREKSIVSEDDVAVDQSLEENIDVDKHGITEMVLVRATDIVDPKTGKSHPTENMPGDSRGFIPLIKKADGLYYVTTYDGEEIAISPTHESVVPRSLLENVELGSDMQKVISEYKNK
tara:strand:+ start:1032 stop:1463 length:432 start_codon:yes stop_codon:yes gene_type:complete